MSALTGENMTTIAESLKIMSEGASLFARGIAMVAQCIAENAAEKHDAPAPALLDCFETCTLPEAAKRLNLSRSTISRLCETGELKYIKDARSGYRRIAVSSIGDYFKRHLQAG